MSVDLYTDSDVDSTHNTSATNVYSRRDTYFNSTIHYTSSLVINIRQLHTDLQAQHQHDKHALNDLNQHLRVFIDRVRQLESQNAKYVAQIADLRRRRPSEVS